MTSNHKPICSLPELITSATDLLTGEANMKPLSIEIYNRI